MNPFNLRNDSLDEIVFENRNKQYGAYIMRKSYNGNLLKASASSLGVFLLMGGILYSISLFKIELPKVVDSVRLTQFEQVIKEIDIILDPPARAVAPPAATATSSEYRIVPDQQVVAQSRVDYPVVNNTNLSGTGAGQGEVNAAGIGDATTTVIRGTDAGGETTQSFVDFVTDMPSFPGGAEQLKKYLANHINYPEPARENGIEGKVVVSFVVMEDGSIGHIQLVKGIGFGCEGEAIRVIESMPKWNAGKQNGKTKAVRMVLPIVFQMQ